MPDPTLAGAELPGNHGRSRPESNLVTAVVVESGRPKNVKGRFLWASPRIEGYCRAGAVKYLRSFWGDEAIPQADLNNEKALLLLSWSLRHADDMDKMIYPWPGNAFNQATGEWNVKALHEAAIRDQCPNRDELWNDYLAFAESEFPGNWTQQQWGALVAAGKELSLETLLSRHGFLQILRALPGLAMDYAMSSTTTGPGGRP